MAVKPIPEGFHTVVPYLVVDGAAKLIEFMKRAFDAKETHPPMSTPDGKIGHAEVKIGDSHVWVSDGQGDWKSQSMICLYVEDVDAVYKRAIEAGGTPVREPSDQFYGDRSGGLKDAFGNQWWIATHVEDVPPAEMQRRHDEFLKKMSAQS